MNKNKTHKTLSVRKETFNELTELKEYGQSYSGVIKKLINVYKETKGIA